MALSRSLPASANTHKYCNAKQTSILFDQTVAPGSSFQVRLRFGPVHPVALRRRELRRLGMEHEQNALAPDTRWAVVGIPAMAFDRGQSVPSVRGMSYASIMSQMRAASVSFTKDFVSTCVPASKYSLPTAAFSTLRSGHALPRRHRHSRVPAAGLLGRGDGAIRQIAVKCCVTEP